MSLNYDANFDYTCVGQLVGLKGKVFHTYRANCYAGALNISDKLRGNREIKYYDFYWADNVSRHFGNVKRANLAISLIKEMGIMKNATVARVRFDKIDERARQKLPESTYYLRLRFNFDRCIGEEMFLIGCIVRTFSSSPVIINNFVRLCRIYKGKIDISHLFLLAYNITWGNSNYPTYRGGHSVVSFGYEEISGVTFKEFISLAKKAGAEPLRISNTYSKLRLEETFVAHKVTEDKYGYWRSSNTGKVTKYSREAVKSFLPKEKV